MIKILLVVFFSVTAFAKEKPLLPKGTILSCPGTNKRMFEVTRDIYRRDYVFKLDRLKILDPSFERDSRAPIPCGLVKGWVNCVHTTKGWVPTNCKFSS